jgi:hypothetical protein
MSLVTVLRKDSSAMSWARMWMKARMPPVNSSTFLPLESQIPFARFWATRAFVRTTGPYPKEIAAGKLVMS